MSYPGHKEKNEEITRFYKKETRGKEKQEVRGVVTVGTRKKKQKQRKNALSDIH